MDCLDDWFDISGNDSQLICFVGGGGKTSLLLAMARYGRDNGWPVLATTTTKMFVPDEQDYDRLVISEQPLSELSQLPDYHGITYCCSGVDSQQHKAIGFSASLCEQFKNLSQFKLILVEADGAKHRPIKAPDIHEPNIPANCDVVIGVIGADIFNQPMTSKNVFRWKQFSQLTSAKEFDYLDISVLHKLLSSDSGLFKGTPATASKIWTINKCDRNQQQRALTPMCQRLLKMNPHIDQVWLTSTQTEPTIKLRLFQN